jgi:hypothetical protein
MRGGHGEGKENPKWGIEGSTRNEIARVRGRNCGGVEK